MEAAQHNHLLCEAERDHLRSLDRLVSQHSTVLDLNLNADVNPPEEDLLLEIRVVQADLGRIATEEGTSSVALEAGTTHFLKRGDVEHLIRQGSVVQLNGEESG